MPTPTDTIIGIRQHEGLVAMIDHAKRNILSHSEPDEVTPVGWLSDLLCDLMHGADFAGIDFTDARRIADGKYADEAFSDTVARPDWPYVGMIREAADALYDRGVPEDRILEVVADEYALWDSFLGPMLDRLERLALEDD